MFQKNLDKNKYKVKEVLQHYLSLEKRGRNYWAICPFHNDTNPSLSISEERNIFKCFSCGVTGDAISFVMKKENISWKEALYKVHTILQLPLEEFTNIEIDSKEYLFKEQLLKFNEFIQQFFEISLYSEEGKKALEYLLNKRKLNELIIKEFRIGYAPSSERILNSIEQIKKVSNDYKFINQEFLLKTGIFMESSFNSNNFKSKVFSLLQNRIIFPIFSKNLEILGFTARKIDDSIESPKYIHSQETILFKKADLFYNLQDLSRLTKDSFIYIFEGIFDLLSMKLISPNKVSLALLGSEISSNGLKLLSNLPTKKLVINLDNDQAGKIAILRIFQKLLRRGLQPYMIPLEYQENKDLSSLYSSNLAIILPEPIEYIEWIKVHWKEFNKMDETNTTEIIVINQIVDFLLSGLFRKNLNKNRFFLFSNLDYEFVFLQISKIFSLYEIIDTTDNEKETIEELRKMYIESINVSSILVRASANNLSIEREFQRNSISKTSYLNDKYFLILQILEEIKKSDQILNVIAKKFFNWKTFLLFEYFENYQLCFSTQEVDFLMKIKESIQEIKDNLFLYDHPVNVIESNDLGEKLKDFFELYFCLIVEIINRIEEYLLSSLNMDFSKRNDLLNNIRSEKDWLKYYISEVFKEIEKWKKN